MRAEALAAMTRRQVLVGSLAAASAGAALADAPLQFGLTPVFLLNDLELLQALERRLSRSTGRPVALVTRRTYREVTALLLSRQIDVAWLCGYPFVQHRDALALLATPVWRGAPLYQSYLIVARDHPARSLDDLRGASHAFADPDSNSGWLTTAAALAARGERPTQFFGHSFFTNGHRNVVRAVASGLADSGSVDGYVWEVLAEVEPALAAETRVIARSAPVGFPPVVAAASERDRPGVRALGAALLGMADDAEGRAVLEMLRLDGFTQGDPSLFDPIAAQSALVRALG